MLELFQFFKLRHLLLKTHYFHRKIKNRLDCQKYKNHPIKSLEGKLLMLQVTGQGSPHKDATDALHLY